MRLRPPHSGPLPHFVANYVYEPRNHMTGDKTGEREQTSLQSAEMSRIELSQRKNVSGFPQIQLQLRTYGPTCAEHRLRRLGGSCILN
jgi:hypothetical protein